MNIVLPKLTGYQKEVWEWLENSKGTGKIAVIKSVRQSGKSFLCQMILIATSFKYNGVTSVIFEPTMQNARIQYKAIEKFFNNSNLVTVANAQLLEIEFINGSKILFRSTEQKNRGMTVTGVMVLDECAYLPDEEIYTILPLVNAHNAPIIIASTPFTEDGYYYEMYMIGMSGENPNVKSFDWANKPEISRFLTEDRKKFYKQTMSPQKYRTEVEGEFLANDGLLFVGLGKCIGVAKDSKIVYLGIDFASGNNGDYTVLTAINGNGQMVKYWRTNNLSPMQQVDWLVGLIADISKQYTIKTIIGEKNSLGVVYIDALNAKIAKYGLQIYDFVTTNSSKQELITNLQIAFENGYITIIDDLVLLNELKRFQATINANTKKITYNGAAGQHDDTVMSLAFAYWAYKKSLGSFSISFI